MGLVACRFVLTRLESVMIFRMLLGVGHRAILIADGRTRYFGLGLRPLFRTSLTTGSWTCSFLLVFGDFMFG
ncbi:hypothetical protein BDV27DRAFT_135309, partial [Aspergillus caelatus]